MKNEQLEAKFLKMITLMQEYEKLKYECEEYMKPIFERFIKLKGSSDSVRTCLDYWEFDFLYSGLDGDIDVAYSNDELSIPTYAFIDPEAYFQPLEAQKADAEAKRKAELDARMRSKNMAEYRRLKAELGLED